jgi:hypothetical protein
MDSSRKWPATLCFLILIFASTCHRDQPARLIAGLLGGESKLDVEAKLTKTFPGQNWHEQTERREPDDKTPPHEITYLSGSFRDLGHAGDIRLTFYNGRLMMAEFWPNDPNVYTEALNKSGFRVPRSPGVEITRGRTRFAYYSDAKGLRFVWEDTAVSHEFSDWVFKYA